MRTCSPLQATPQRALFIDMVQQCSVLQSDCLSAVSEWESEQLGLSEVLFRFPTAPKILAMIFRLPHGKSMLDLLEVFHEKAQQMLQPGPQLDALEKWMWLVSRKPLHQLIQVCLIS